MYMTPNLEVLFNFVNANYKLKSGITNCRKISGSQNYSQHSWSNAIDIYTANKGFQDKMASELKAEFGSHIRNVLTWRYNAAHWNHIHVDMWPKGMYTPPCEGGALRVKHKDGTRGTVFTADIEGGDDMTPEQESAVNWLVAARASRSADTPPWGGAFWDDYMDEWGWAPGPLSPVTHIQLAFIYTELKNMIGDGPITEADFEDIVVRSLKA